MRIGKKFIVPVICMAAFTVFCQETNNAGKSVEELKKLVILNPVVETDFRDKDNQKFQQFKMSTAQDKDMGFNGTLRVTVELTGEGGEVWYGQMSKPQGKRRPDYIGTDDWTCTIPHGELKYPKAVYAIEYGYQTTNKDFVAIQERLRKVASADEIMARNKGSKNKLKLKITGKAQHETEE